MTFVIGNQEVGKGKRLSTQIVIARSYDYTELSLPVEVIRGQQDGPTLFVSAAIHGDEINGIEIIKRLLNTVKIKNLKGTLIAVPIVNVFGFNAQSRYLPDRRDLNRCFPGTKKGSLGSRLARVFMEEIVDKSDYGIDLHTAAIHRRNLPQIRACLDDPKTKELALAFGTPVLLNSKTRDGSLREAVRSQNKPMLLFEGGEALRLNERAIKYGLRGILNVMDKIGMMESKKKTKPIESFVANGSQWIRSPHSGMLKIFKKESTKVKKDQLLATISDPFGKNKIEIRAPYNGIVIGRITNPLVNLGDALFHLATFDALALESISEDYIDQTEM